MLSTDEGRSLPDFVLNIDAAEDDFFLHPKRLVWIHPNHNMEKADDLQIPSNWREWLLVPRRLTLSMR